MGSARVVRGLNVPAGLAAAFSPLFGAATRAACVRTRLVAVHGALLAKGGACGTHAPLLFFSA
jgi:hypothetical protein